MNVKKNIFEIIFLVIGIILLIQGVLAYVFYNTASVEEAIATQETKRGNSFSDKLLDLFEFDFLANVTFFIAGIGLGAILQSLEWIIFRFIQNKAVSLTVKISILMLIVVLIVIYILFLINRIELKDNKSIADKILAIQVGVALLGILFSSLIVNFFEIIDYLLDKGKFGKNLFENEFKKITEKLLEEDLPATLGVGFILLGVVLFLQSVSNGSMYLFTKRPSGTAWFGWTSLGFLITSIISIIVGIGLFVAGG